MQSGPWAALAAVPILVALNAFFVVSEYAVVAARPVQIEAMRARGHLAAATAMSRLKGDPASAIGAIQVCITMTNLLLGWIGEPAMSALLETLFRPLVAVTPHSVFTAVSTGLSFILVTLVTVVFSELLPKALTLRNVDLAARTTAVPVLCIQRAIFPLVWLMNATANAVTRPLGLGRVEDFEDQRVTSDELRLMAEQAAADGVVTPRERSIILNALVAGRRTARQIMVPRVNVACLDLRKSMDANYETAKVDHLLEVFHERRAQLVFLVDEYGGVEGIVTLRDVFDELLGGRAE
jgi:CBS domain containing-hemolysin-like protein